MAVRCGNRKVHGIDHHHADAATVRACFQSPHGLMSLEDEADDEATFQAAAEAERAYERHLERNDQYAWECEQDELRAAWGLPG